MAQKVLPKDGQIRRYAGPPASTYAIYIIPGSDVVVYWKIPDENFDVTGMHYDESPLADITQDTTMAHMVNGGDANELTNIGSDFGTFGQWVTSLTTSLFGDNPAKDDPEIKRVLAQKIARPDMSDAELEGLLRQTNWFKQRSDVEREWNDLSDAERLARIDETASRLSETYFRETGARIAFDDGTLRSWAQQVASGRTGYGAVLETWIRPAALQNPESPWSRTIRNEQENQRKRGVDIENRSQGARELAERWGIQMSDQSLAEWGAKLMGNEASDADFVQFLQDQAKILYPWKDPTVPTMDAARPWLDTYSRVLETGNPSLFNPEVQKALNAGMPLFEFEKELKSRPEWLETGNANRELSAMGAQIGRQFGFV